MPSLLLSTSASSALTVVIPPTTYCGGGYVEGEVLLNFRQLQKENLDEVRVQLSGNIHTRLRRNQRLYEEKHQILSSVFSLWTRGSAYPQPGTDVLRFPFRFLLPDILPPSFNFHALEITSAVSYTIDSVGVRRCKLKINKKVHTPIAALPKDDARVWVRLREGPTCEPYTQWKNVWAEEKIRKELRDKHATVRIMVSTPDVPALPLFTPLPFLITITTITAPMTHAKALSHPQDKPIFPTPPQKHGEIDFRLYRKLALAPQGFRWTTDDAVAFFFGAKTVAGDVVAEVAAEKEWLPEEGETGAGADDRGEEMGRWLQRTTFSSTFTLDVPPTFSALTISVSYCLSLKVLFPGIGNDMLFEIPVTITSGINEHLDKSEPLSEPRPYSCRIEPKPEA